MASEPHQASRLALGSVHSSVSTQGLRLFCQTLRAHPWDNPQAHHKEAHKMEAMLIIVPLGLAYAIWRAYHPWGKP